MLDRRPSMRSRPLGRYTWHGKPIYYRPGTSDSHVIYSVLLRTGNKAEYNVPESLAPKVILDIGGNIGITSIYFASRFPEARIYTFEPVPDNVELLRRNTEGYPQVMVLPVALGSIDGRVEINYSDNLDNFGGFSFFNRGSNTERRLSVEKRNVRALLKEIGIDRVDFIKIDTEGAEYEILTALDPEIIRQVTWITGELHGEKDFELLAYLSQWFDIGAKKSIGKRLFLFTAVNKSRIGNA